MAVAQVITVAHNPETGEQRSFATPADVPEGWVEGAAPDPDTTPREGTTPGGRGNKEDQTPRPSPLLRLGKAAVAGYILWKLWGRLR